MTEIADILNKARSRFGSIEHSDVVPLNIPDGIDTESQIIDASIGRSEIAKQYYKLFAKENNWFPIQYKHFKIYFPEDDEDAKRTETALVFNLERFSKNYLIFFMDYDPNTFYNDISRFLMCDPTDMRGFVRLRSHLPYLFQMTDGLQYTSRDMTNHRILLIPKTYNVDVNKFNNIFRVEDSYTTDSYFYSLKREVKHCSIPSGYYPNCSSIVDALNSTIPSECKPYIQFKLSAMDIIEIISSDCRLYSVEFPLPLEGSLGEMLGLNSDLIAPIRLPPIQHGKENYLFLSKFVFPYSIDIQRGIYSLYVYTDITEEQIVGNSFSHLLRVISVDDSKMAMNKQAFSNESYYVPLRVKQINSITIVIKNDLGNNIHFTSGKTICQLHFRKTS
jgi:hypothetical protein